MPSRSANAAAGSSRPWTIARRLFAWYAATAFILVFAATAILYLGLAREFKGGDEDRLLGRVRLVQSILRHSENMLAELKWEVQLEQEESVDADLYVRVYNRQRTTSLETEGMTRLLPTEVFPAPARARSDEPSLRLRTPSGGVFRLMAAEAAGVGPDDRWIIQAALDLNAEETVLNRYRNLLLMVLGASALASLGCAFRITQRGLRPLAEIVETTRRISSVTLSSERVRLNDLPADLATLAGHFNDMLDRLEESFSRLSRFSADIAHELRTPLNNLRGEAEVALGRARSTDEYREVLASSLEEYDHLSGIVESLLFIALAERLEVAVNRERTDVAAELRAIAEFYELVAAERQLRLELDAAGELWTELDHVLFRRAVSNLVSNSLAYTPAGGRILISARPLEGGIRVEVADSGIGIAPDHLPHVFDRFYRVQRTSPGGCGLGLSIVQTIMTLHRGTVEIFSTVGCGTRAVLTFPRTGTDASVPSVPAYQNNPPQSTDFATITKP